jgi:integrase
MSGAKALALRELELLAIRPGPSAYGDLLKQLIDGLLIMSEGRWYDLPEAEYERQTSRHVRALQIGVAFIAFAGAVTLLSFIPKLGAAASASATALVAIAVAFAHSAGPWVASVTVGYTTSGKRIVKRARGRTKTEAQRKLKAIIRDYEDGLVIGAYGYTVADAVQDWLAFGLSGRDGKTVTKCTILANTHIIPVLGARKLRDLSADDIDIWLADMAQVISTRSLREVRSVLKRAITRAQARDKVKRNVVLLCDIPQGRTGRPSKSLTLAQAEALLAAAEGTSLHAYIVVSLLTRARTEELRPLTWSHVDLDSDPPFIMVWRSVRAGGDTKTRKSRRTLKLPQRCVDVLRGHKTRQDLLRQAAGTNWHANDLVFPSQVGTPADASHVRRSFRKVVEAAGLDPGSGLPASYGTASSHCSPTPEFRSSRSRGWSGTAEPRPRKRSTASRSAR